jgi:hypothetical protein
MTMVMLKVKLFSVTQFYKLVCQLASPTLLGISSILQELLLHNAFPKFYAISHIRQPFVLMYLLQFFVSFLLHSLHSNYNNPQKTQSCLGATSNARKLNNHSLFLFFHLG